MMNTPFVRPSAVIVLTSLCGSALAQSGLDLDRAYASQLLSDARARSSLLGSGSAASLDIEVMTQIRYTLNSRDEQTAGALGDSDTSLGFSTPRTQVRISGKATDTVSGLVIFDFGAAERGRVSGVADGTADLLVAQARWALDDSWSLIVGQMHSAVLGEENFAPEHTLAAERSLTNEFFNLGYTQGISAAYTSDSLRFVGAFSDGGEYPGNFGPVASSAFTAPGEGDYALSGRLDWLVQGTWDQFDDATSWRSSNYGLRLGAGLHWQSQGDTNPAVPAGAPAGFDDRTFTLWTLDAQIEGDGWNLFAEYVGHRIDTSAAADVDVTNHGFVLQGGLFVADQVELFARYDIIMLDDALVAAGTDDNYQGVTLGMNYYFVPESHAARFTIDAVLAPDDSTNLDALLGGGGASDTGTTGLLGLSDSEAMLRAQLTLVF